MIPERIIFVSRGITVDIIYCVCSEAVILILQYFTVIDEFATLHPVSILTVHTLSARYSKCFMFSVCVVTQLSIARYDDSAVAPAQRQTRPPPRGDHFAVVCGTVLCYKSEGRWFDPSWCHWNFSLT